MNATAVQNKIRGLVSHAEKTWRTKDRTELLEKLKTKTMRTMVRRWTQSDSRGGRRICRQETIRFWKNFKKFKGDASISMDELHDLGHLIGSRVMTPRAKIFLANVVVRRLGLTKTKADRDATSQGDKFRGHAVSCLRNFAGRGFAGFYLNHGGKRFHYRPGVFFEIANLIQDESIEIVRGDLKGKRGSFSAKRNVIRIRSSLTGVVRDSVIIHEAVHAIQDLYDLPGTRLMWEVGAHIAQGMHIAAVNGIESLHPGDEKNKGTGKRLGDVSFMAMVDHANSSKQPVTIPSLVLSDAIKVLAKFGYRDEAGVAVKQSTFDDNGNFVDLWLRL